MENASKALLMGGAVLIGVMLISFAVIIFQIFGKFSKEQQEQISDKTIQQFNMQFLVYEGENKTAHDVVSVIHLVKNIDNNITVTVPGNRVTKDSSEEELLEYLKETNEEETKYKCSVIYDDSGKVQKIKFETQVN